jgi:tRNA U34 5-methylaminomethyl-2-thiouridine-forming methyltransferase MnmC
MSLTKASIHLNLLKLHMKSPKEVNGESPDDSIRVLRTDDSSPTLYSAHFEAHYHSTHGAITESQHVFIEAGALAYLSKYCPERLSIFEMGFGSGLNAYLTANNPGIHRIPIMYHAIEKHPVDGAVIDMLAGYFSRKENEGSETVRFEQMHGCAWGEEVELGSCFRLFKQEGDIQEVVLGGGYHVVYYDAFGPGTQPELWQEGVLRGVYDAMATPGCLVTYCAQGAFRRVLKGLGMEVERLDGPPGKREMTRAWKL